MESIYTELSIFVSLNKCARTDTVLLPISEVCDSTVSLKELLNIGPNKSNNVSTHKKNTKQKHFFSHVTRDM